MATEQHRSNIALIRSILFMVTLLTVISAFPTKALAVLCSWEDGNGVLQLTDDRSKAPQKAQCDDTEEQPIVRSLLKTDKAHAAQAKTEKTDRNRLEYSQLEIRLPESEPPPLRRKPTNAQLAATICWLLSNRLHLPLPATMVVHLYPDKSSFIDGLIQVGGETSEMAIKKVNTFGSFASRNGLLMRSDLLARMPLMQRAKTFAHELAHLSQYKLGESGRRWPAQWLREGHADWVAFQMLETMGLRSFSQSRELVISEIKAPSAAASVFPDLDGLDHIRKWTEVKSRLGRPATYGQSFLAVDWLIERYGHAKLLELMGKYASDAEYKQVWGMVYPVSQRQFINEFHNRLKSI